MAETVHSGTRNDDERDTDSPLATKAGLEEESNQGLSEAGGTDTDDKGTTKVGGLGED